MPVTVGGPSAPIETPTTPASPHPQSEGGFATATGAAYRQSPVVTMMMRGYGDLAYGDQTIPHDKAAEVVKAQGLDPAFIPKEGIGYGALQEEIQRQGDMKIRQMEFQRSGGGPGFLTGLAAGVTAGIADPSNLVLGPAAGRIAALARGGLAFRAATGAGIAAAYQGGMEAGEAHLTGHDEDINSWTMLRDVTFAAGLGGITGAAFGPRPLPPGDMSAHLSMISYAENTAAAAKRLGIPINEVVSPKGAIGEYQIEPATAKQYGFDPSRLKEPEYNKEVATAILRDLDKRFNGDPDAIAVAWNAGPGRAAKWLKSGKDMATLPTETRNYLKRIMARGGYETFGSPYRSVNPQDRETAAKWALQQFAVDKTVDVGPLADTLSAMRELAIKQEGDVRSTGIDDTQKISANQNVEGPPEHIAADWQDHLPDIAQRGPATPANAKELYERLQARGFDMEQTSPQSTRQADTPTEIKAYFDKMEQKQTEAPQTTPAAQTAQSAEAAAITKRTEDARAALPDHMTEGFDAAVAAAEKAPVEGSLTHDEVTKAAIAAAKCAALKGADLAA